MASVVDPTYPQPAASRPMEWLEQGERLDRETFHARYCAMPKGTRAELIEGVVWMPSPLYFPHGATELEVHGWLRDFCMKTPGVVAVPSVTTLLGENNEIQPDAALMIAAGSETRAPVPTEGCIVGAPELVVEIAASTAPFDLFEKKALYERYGVREYIVVLIREPKRVLWFASREEQFAELPLGEDGFFRSEVFPGLWLDPLALLRLNSARVREVLELGLATPEHAEFVRRLGSAPTE